MAKIGLIFTFVSIMSVNVNSVRDKHDDKWTNYIDWLKHIKNCRRNISEINDKHRSLDVYAWHSYYKKFNLICIGSKKPPKSCHRTELIYTSIHKLVTLTYIRIYFYPSVMFRKVWMIYVHKPHLLYYIMWVVLLTVKPLTLNCKRAILFLQQD